MVVYLLFGLGMGLNTVFFVLVGRRYPGGLKANEHFQEHTEADEIEEASEVVKDYGAVGETFAKNKQ